MAALTDWLRDDAPASRLQAYLGRSFDVACQEGEALQACKLFCTGHGQRSSQL